MAFLISKDCLSCLFGQKESEEKSVTKTPGKEKSYTERKKETLNLLFNVFSRYLCCQWNEKFSIGCNLQAHSLMSLHPTLYTDLPDIFSFSDQ